MTDPKQDFKKLLEDHLMAFPNIGDIVKGTIISVDKNEVRIDVQNLTTAIVRGREMFSESREYSDLKPGDETEATVIDLENENGEMELSFRIAGMQRVWDNMRKWMAQGITIKAKVYSANKGGLMVQVGAINGFMPVSQLNPDHYPRVAGGDKNIIFEKLQEMIGQDLEVKVIDVNEKEEKLIVSEKAVWEDDQKAVLEAYKVGDVVDGEISAITSFGVFVRFGEGLEGLVHISEIAWQRIDHPKDLLKVGDKIRAQIIQLDHSKIYLSIKRLVDDPWKKVKDKFKVGDTVKGKIIKVEPFGLMVSLDKEIHGLAHISELSDDPIANINDKFKIGQELEMVVVSLEPAEHRLGLRMAGVKGKTGRKAEAAAKVVEDQKNDEEEVVKKLDELAAVEAVAEAGQVEEEKKAE
ncbi:MAG: S1 RNA-binding domain-containing protein [Candidatus Magasanikbacteria bacterium]|nr:S1 RNA-binding domain-containing protein [Candidatus Magasanikbacteria bacterium]